MGHARLSSVYNPLKRDSALLFITSERSTISVLKAQTKGGGMKILLKKKRNWCTSIFKQLPHALSSCPSSSSPTIACMHPLIIFHSVA